MLFFSCGNNISAGSFTKDCRKPLNYIFQKRVCLVNNIHNNTITASITHTLLITYEHILISMELIRKPLDRLGIMSLIVTLLKFIKYPEKRLIVMSKECQHCGEISDGRMRKVSRCCLYSIG